MWQDTAQGRTKSHWGPSWMINITVDFRDSGVNGLISGEHVLLGIAIMWELLRSSRTAFWSLRDSLHEGFWDSWRTLLLNFAASRDPYFHKMQTFLLQLVFFRQQVLVKFLGFVSMLNGPGLVVSCRFMELWLIVPRRFTSWFRTAQMFPECTTSFNHQQLVGQSKRLYWP